MPKKARKNISCDSCIALMINGMFCHETGCPNTSSRYDAESGSWIKQRKCFDCGYTVDADEDCCFDDGSDPEFDEAMVKAGFGEVR